MRAVSHATFPVPPWALTNEQWGNQAIEDALFTRKAVYDKLRHARRCSVAAAVATSIALVLALLDTHVETKAATLTLHRDGQAGFRALCRGAADLTGTLQVNSLDSQFVSIKLAPGTCGKSTRTLRIDRSDVVGVLTK